MGLGFYMRRKLLNVHILDLALLAEKYRSEERSKSKPFTRKEKVAYVTMESSEEEIDFETEVDLAELKKGPPYSNHSKLKSGKKYSFDISKSYQIFDVLLKDKQLILSEGRTLLSIKDRDISLCPRCNAVFDAEAAAIFEKVMMKKELAHREEQAHQRQPIRHFESQSSKAPQQSTVAPLSRSQAIGVQSSRKGTLCIDITRNGDIEDFLEINIPIIVVEPGGIQEAEEEEEISIKLKSLR
ncbi:hypothetical protein Ahy_B03g064407 [Arachis hypogaea]|uniref:Uncharacterized protein n=1 Tax=Arachis hypogaea TaxID=3818 RepID=A0A444ZZI9_ARAHY|nr:hypothetical protein Ahy_B03g064407 [Arachis hypogaea]